MRKALVSLIAGAAVAAMSAAALAQEIPAPPEPAAEPTVPDPVAVPVPPEPVITPESAPATVAPEPAPTVQPSASADVTAVPANPAPAVAPAPVVQAPPAPPPPPPPPTDPTTIRVLNTVESVCKPLVLGGDVASITASQGFRKKKEAYVLAMEKPYTITLTHSATNKNVCMLEINHAIRGDEAITRGLHDWAMARGYTLYRNDEFTTDLKRHTRSWELVSGDKTEALVLITSRKPDGSPLSRKADHSSVMYSVR